MMSSQVTEVGFQSSPPTSTPTLVRSRPKLPTIFGRGRDDGVEDLVGVISTWGNTDFVSKYSTKRRKRTTGTGGVSSPSQQGNASLPVSPMSPVLSPRTKSPPPDGKATITLTRMIKLKLEEVKERQDRAAEMSKSGGNIPRRKTGTVDAPCLGTGGVCLSQDSLRDSIHPSSSTPSLERSQPDRSEKSLSTSSPSVIHCTSDSLEKIDQLQSTPEKEEKYLPNRTDILLSESITHNVDNDDPVTKTSGDSTLHRISDSSRSNIESVKSSSGTERDSDSSLHVTEDESSSARRKTRLQRTPPLAHEIQKDNGDSSNELEDEGIGAMDIEEDTSIDPRLLDKLSQFRNAPGSNHDKNGESLMDVTELPGKSLQILSPKLQQEEFKQNADASINKRGTANGRFLTHPPSKDKPIVNEGGSVDSNGLGALRTNKEPVKTNDLTSQVSEVSIDSHLCPSDMSETPTYRDVVIDVTSEPTGADKFEKKNNKSFKQKSKSDPSGEKQKQLEDLPTVIGTHAQSVPALSEKGDETPPIISLQSSEENKTKSKSENLLTKPPKSPHPHIARLKETQITRSTSEESSEESLPPVPKIVKARRALKKRRAGAVDLPKPPASERDSSRDEGDNASPRLVSQRAATSPLIANLSPVGGLVKLKAKTSLTLPMAKKSGINRSHSSAVDYSTRTGQQNDGFKSASPNLGARSKSSDKTKLGKRRPPIPDLTSHKSFTWAGSGSTPELSSPRTRGDRATYSPRLDTIFSGSSLSLFEGAAEDKVRTP